MYSKEDLSAKTTAELQDIAQEMGIDVASDDNAEGLMYAILDRQAEIEGSKNPLGATKRRRTRITKKDTDRVYTVNGKEGENFDVKKDKVEETEQQTQSVETVNVEQVPMSPEEMLMAIPKHRGRKSKKELELLSAIEERKRMDEIAAQGTESEESSIPDVQKTQPEVLNADNINDTDIPEASLGNDEKIADEDSVDDDMLA